MIGTCTWLVDGKECGGEVREVHTPHFYVGGGFPPQEKVHTIVHLECVRMPGAHPHLIPADHPGHPRRLP